MITRAALLRTANDNGDTWNRVKWHEERRVVAARAEGLSVREIANRFRLSQQTVYRILRRQP